MTYDAMTMRLEVMYSRIRPLFQFHRIPVVSGKNYLVLMGYFIYVQSSRMVREAEMRQAQDEKHQLEVNVFSVKQALDQTEDELYESEKNSCKQECDNVLRQLVGNTLAKKEEIDDKMQYIQKVCTRSSYEHHRKGADTYEASQTGVGRYYLR